MSAPDPPTDLVARLREVVGASNVFAGSAIPDEYTHDEALTAEPVRPLAVVRPADASEVAAILRIAVASRTPVTARGSGTGLSGASIPRPDGIVCALDRMQRILEIDLENHCAVV
jgi:glycolate dehydrogenase FAD-linked subunit